MRLIMHVVHSDIVKAANLLFAEDRKFPQKKDSHLIVVEHYRV